MSIRLRLAALFTLAVGILMSVGGYVYIRQLRSGLDDTLDQSLRSRTAQVAADPSGPLPNGDSGYVQIYSRTGRISRGSAALSGARLLDPRQFEAARRGVPLHANRSLRVVEASGKVDVKSLRVYGTRTHVAGRVVAVAVERDLIDDALQRSTHQVTILGVIVFALAGPSSWLLARAALRPVERMRAQVARLDAAEPGEGVPLPRARDEIARLGRTFNGLLARVHDALEHERSFVADAGHELRTPLTVLKGEFELAQRPGRSREELLTTVGIATEETDRLIRLTENLLGIARAEPVRQRPFDLVEVTRNAIAAAAPGAATRDVSLTLRDRIGGDVYGDPDRLRQAVDNLVSNAARHSSPGGTVTVRLGRDSVYAIIEVTDDGPGFPHDFLPTAFDRFTRADDARSRSEGGNGLGLAVVATIMATHDGTATAANRRDGGAVLTLRWKQPADGGLPSDTPGR